MRKLYALSFLCILISARCMAQELDFKVEMKPEHKYEQTLLQSSEMKLNFSGSKEFMKKMKEKGMANHSDTKKSSTMETVNRTGKLSGDNSFPITMEFTNSTSSDGKMSIPNGTLIFGHSSTGNLPTLDSITSAGMDDDQKRLMLKSMQNLFSQITYPQKKMKVGESFSKETPISMPMAGMLLTMTITTTYKLIRIENGTARFDITQVYTLTSVVNSHAIKATGKGKGYLDYDVANNFYSNYQIESSMDMHMKTDMYTLKLKSINSYVQKAKISVN